MAPSAPPTSTPPISAARNDDASQLRGDHPGEREDRPDRQVDPGDEDREELAHADQDGDRALDEDLRDVVGRQEVL
jgi:hypothetical protein